VILGYSRPSSPVQAAAKQRLFARYGLSAQDLRNMRKNPIETNSPGNQQSQPDKRISSELTPANQPVLNAPSSKAPSPFQLPHPPRTPSSSSRPNHRPRRLSSPARPLAHLLLTTLACRHSLEPQPLYVREVSQRRPQRRRPRVPNLVGAAASGARRAEASYGGEGATRAPWIQRALRERNHASAHAQAQRCSGAAR